MKLRYTPIDEAKEILIERQQDEELQSRLQLMTGGIEPGLGYGLQPESEPALIFAEYVARPTVRDALFALSAKAYGLVPVWATYRADSFTTTNKKKVSMLRPTFATPNKQSVSKRWIVATENRQKPNAEIGNLPTIFKGGGTVSSYWESLRELILPKYGLSDTIFSVVDLSTSYKAWAVRSNVSGSSIAGGYYPAVMGMYAARSALFSDFEPYTQFKDQIAEPAYVKAADTLGVEPVIVKPPEFEPQTALDGTGRLVQLDQTDITDLTETEVEDLLNDGLIRRGYYE